MAQLAVQGGEQGGSQARTASAPVWAGGILSLR